MKQLLTILIFSLSWFGQYTLAQVTVSGTVFDSTGVYPVQSVSVLATNGRGTVTNSNGDYRITVSETDSIWFSYLNKPTRKFPVKSIKNPFSFNISLQTFVSLLPDVSARNRNFKKDSIQNRQDYAKIFDYEKPGLKPLVNSDGTVGFDLNEIINSFKFRKNKQMLAFQNRLITQEQETYIRHRFSKANVRRITEATEDSVITIFINTYLPSYFFAKTASDYVFFKYIKDSYQRFKLGLMPPPLWREGATAEGNYDLLRKEN